MLEEALRNEKHNPNETALNMLSFLQVELTAAGATAEARLYKTLYGPLCERIFGPILGEKEGYRHKDGGWLSASSRWSRAPSMASNPSSSPLSRNLPSNASLSRAPAWESDPVVKLLATRDKSPGRDPGPPSLIEAISNESENRPSVGFSFPFHALPKSTQEAWLALLDISMGGKPLDVYVTDNETRLMKDLLRKPPVEQRGLIQFRQKAAQKKDYSQAMQLSPLSFSPPVRSFQTSPNNKVDEDVPANVILSMLEYYLFVFIRYPLALPISKSSSSSVSRSVQGSSHSYSREPFWEAVYFYLFRRYLQHFLPHKQEDNRYVGFDTYTSSESEMFLRIVIELWMESRNRVVPTAKVVQAISERRTRAGVKETPMDLDLSFDLIQVKYEAPTMLVKRCLYELVVHVMLDPAIQLATTNDALQSKGVMSSAMRALQQPLYNYIRSTFRHASMHATDSPFFSALELWLVWLEPWNAKKKTPQMTTKQIVGSLASGERTTDRLVLEVPKSNAPSNYTTSWGPYVAANIYMYVVPFAIFLHRSRELDFSEARFERSIGVVKRVFRVFSPNVVDAIGRVLNAPTTFLHLVQEGKNLLGIFAPPEGPLSLKSCQNDMHGLLEEIHRQHAKKVRDLDIVGRFAAKVEGVMGMGVVSGEAKELDGLVERATLIVGLPLDYEIFRGGPALSAGVASQHGAVAPSRTEDGMLTDEGREQLRWGESRCDPLDIKFESSHQKEILASHELALLVTITAIMSDWLNAGLGLLSEWVSTKLGLPRPKENKPWSISFRFLADYRNLLLVCFATYVIVKLLCLLVLL